MDYYAFQDSLLYPSWKASVIEYQCCPGGSCCEKWDDEDEEIKDAIQETYGDVACANDVGQCCGNPLSCCGTSAGVDVDYSMLIGYSLDEILSAPQGANMGLGCGNPSLFAGLKAGDTVLDLGAGGGFDLFLASKIIGPTGKGIGIDMTLPMIQKARKNAENGGLSNIEFRLGEIEDLPVEDDSIDVIISNCVINLSTDKQAVFDEAFRVLKEGGRLAVSDIVATRPLPENIKNDLKLYCACISGAMSMEELNEALQDAGFHDIEIIVKPESRMFIKNWAPEQGAENYVAFGSDNSHQVNPGLKAWDLYWLAGASHPRQA